MPNARRVRQDAEAAARRYAEYGNLIANYNANVDKMNSGNAAAVALYNQQVEEFKAFQKSVEEGHEYAIADIGVKGSIYEGPKDTVALPYTEEEQKTLAAETAAREQYAAGKQAELTAQWKLLPNDSENQIQPPIYNIASDPDAPAITVKPTYVSIDSPEGIKALQDQPQGQFAMVKGKDGKLVAAKTDERGVKDAGALVDALPPATQQIPGFNFSAPGMGGGTATQQVWLRNGDGTATQYQREGGAGQWQAVTPAIRILAWEKKEPVQQTDAGPVPEQPKDWNPSLRERAELDNPTANAAGANMAAAMGSYTKTGLMNEASRNSQSLTNSDTGVLNRVMQGIL